MGYDATDLENITMDRFPKFLTGYLLHQKGESSINGFVSAWIEQALSWMSEQGSGNWVGPITTVVDLSCIFLR